MGAYHKTSATPAKEGSLPPEAISSHHYSPRKNNNTTTNDSTILKHKKETILGGSCDPGDRGNFKILIDENQHIAMSLRSPTDSKIKLGSTPQKHRGYSILNMPVNVMVESDDSNHHEQN